MKHTLTARLRLVFAGTILATGLLGCEAKSQSGPQFLGISDLHYDYDEADKEGSQYCFKCETTQDQLDLFTKQAKALIKDNNLEFIIVTGDLPGHRPWYKEYNKRKPGHRYGWTEAELEATAKKITVEFTRTLDTLWDIAEDSKIPVIIAPGNNDAIGGDYCSFENNRPIKDLMDKTPFDFASPGTSWPVNHGAVLVDGTHVDKGYYSVYPKSGSKLRIIMLNTVIFTSHYGESRCVDDQQGDTNQHIEWLYDQMQDAESKGESIYLAMHVPPGNDAFGGTMWDSGLAYTGDKAELAAYKDQWVQDAYLAITTAKADRVKGVFTGHTHLNGIRRIENCSGDFVELAQSIPGITTDHQNLPGMKVFKSDSNFEVTAADTYFAAVVPYVSYDWDNANLFKFRDIYDCDDCSQTGLYDYIKAMSAKPGGDQKVLSSMVEYITLKSPKTFSTSRFQSALDVQCNLAPSSEN